MVSHKSKREIKFIKKESPFYPSLLREIADPPVDKIIELTKLEPRVVNRSLALLCVGNFIKETERGYSI